ncbi:type II toxin-antitoxin system Phd/YefM family antitoxin, partial [Microcoleus sp. D3_18_C4]|uniref:type II toxin-antitoxin system Phd/YefM family antitoxin n=1 Tax=Microcoleus sp. D3_18_C4 TaxID=3055335 RepID=UPI003B1A1F7A
MTQLNVNLTNDRFPELIARVEDTGERIVIEQEGRAIAAIITYSKFHVNVVHYIQYISRKNESLFDR